MLSLLHNLDGKTGDLSGNTRILVFDREKEKPPAEYIYRFEAATEFDPGPKT